MSDRAPYESAPTTRMDAQVAPAGDVFQIGDLVGDTYEIRSLLGEGGMGQVYEAFDQRLNRIVAIKVAWPTVDATSVRKEARALAAIRHPCVIAVYAAGEHKGTEYIVMERLLGETLQTHIRRRVSAGKPFSFPDAIDILIHVAEGLAVVHKAGIAHRDVKPDNVMLAPGDRTVLMDFGVFVPEFEAAQHSGASGSPAYMAPETISGTVSDGGGFLVDVYAFGVLAFELLTGELPFASDAARGVDEAPVGERAARARSTTRCTEWARRARATHDDQRSVRASAGDGRGHASPSAHGDDVRIGADQRALARVGTDAGARRGAGNPGQYRRAHHADATSRRNLTLLVSPRYGVLPL